ncbi:MAG: proliferating cell nuclear antigen (pcna) [Promethearchaeia archaeon]
MATQTVQKTKGTGFELELENSKVLKSIIDTIASIIDETEMTITPDALQISAMDPSRICLLKLEITREHFDHYECDKSYKIGINLSDFDKIMSRANSNDSVKLKFTPKHQKIKIIMQTTEATRVRTFSLALLDIDIEEIPMDNLLSIAYPTSWVTDPNFLVEAIKDAEIYSEILNITATANESLTFQSSGQIGDMEYYMAVENLIDSEINEDAAGAYSLTFLKAVMKLKSITEKLEISLKTDHPLKMVFNLLEGGELNYFLAPRVEETEFDEDDMEEL